MIVPNNITGIELIAEERLRQIQQEGWTPEHDAQHEHDSLALAAVCYAYPPRVRVSPTVAPVPPRLWPWETEWWKPTPDNRVRELVKAGALIAAEIDRLNAKTYDSPEPTT